MSAMFQFKLPRAYVCHLFRKAGGAPDPLSPLVRLWTDLSRIAPDPDPGAECPLAEAALVSIAATLLRPRKLTAVRIGGHRNVPEQRRFASVDKNGVQSGMLALPSGEVLLEGFETEDDLVRWLAAAMAPLQLAHQAGARLVPETLTTGQYLHLLHLIDFYRRCHYQSMLDYTAEDEMSFSSLSFAETLFESLHSGDYRWILPAANLLAPTSITGPGEDSFRWLGEHGLVTRANEARHAGLWTFDEIGDRLGLEFFTGWLGSAGIETGHSTDRGPRRGRDALVVHTSVKGLHSFRCSHDGSVHYQPLGAADLPGFLHSFLDQPAGEGVPALEKAASRNETPSKPVHHPKFCVNCGNPLQPTVKFCPSCGTKVPGV